MNGSPRLIAKYPAGGGDVDPQPTPVNVQFVKTLSLAYNLIVNVYGSQFTGNGGSAYKWESIEDPTGGGYTVKQLYQGSSPVQDESVIKAYLKLMTGTDYLPVYSANVPNDEFVFCTSTQELWKYQYQSGYGLFVFKVVNFPFALKSEIPVVPEVADSMATITSFDETTYYDGKGEKMQVDLHGVGYPCVVKAFVEGASGAQTIYVYSTNGGISYNTFSEGEEYFDYFYVSDGKLTLARSGASDSDPTVSVKGVIICKSYSDNN